MSFKSQFISSFSSAQKKSASQSSSSSSPSHSLNSWASSLSGVGLKHLFQMLVTIYAPTIFRWAGPFTGNAISVFGFFLGNGFQCYFMYPIVAEVIDIQKLLYIFWKDFWQLGLWGIVCFSEEIEIVFARNCNTEATWVFFVFELEKMIVVPTENCLYHLVKLQECEIFQERKPFAKPEVW